MKVFRVLALISICSLTAVWVIRAQGTQGTESVAKPKKKTTSDDGSTPATEPDAEKIPSKYSSKGKENLPQGVPTFRSDVISVSVDVAVLDNHGNFIPKIPKENFRILEDNVPQQVTGYTVGEAPMTICMVIEFSNRFQRYYSGPWMQTLNAAYGFLRTLKPEDYLAVVAYDLRPEILSDFSTDRMQAQEALSRLRIASFSEANLFDALTDTAKRMEDIEGRKAILLISSGIDTFSKITFDQARKNVQDAGVPIYAIGLMQTLRELIDARGGMGSVQRLDFLQADNEMRTFAKESGGQAYFPRFEGEMPGIFGQIQESMRNQYVLTYQPSNQVRDGKFRKIKVVLVNPETNEPLKLIENGKPTKYQVIAKAGYKAPREVE